MAKVKVKQTSEVLSPTGERIMKIWYDSNTMPPKNYIWCKGDDEYYIWDNGKWIPYEFEIINQKDKSGCNKNNCCDCINKEEFDTKLNQFKKELLTAVLKLVKNGGDVDIDSLVRVINNIDNRVTTIERAGINLDGYATEQWVENKHYLTEHQSLSNYYTKSQLANEGFVRVIDITLQEYEEMIDKDPNVIYNITDAEAYHYDPDNVNDQLAALRTRVAGVEGNVGAMVPVVNRLNNIDHSQYVTSTDLNGYATEDYVTAAVANVVNSAPEALDTLNELATALNNDSNFATTITNALANKVNASDLATVATTGDYNDLHNKPSVPDEFVVAKVMNELNDRVTDLENSEFMTQTEADELYEPKFTDLTNEVDPETAAQTHTSDDKVYITEVIEPQQGGN